MSKGLENEIDKALLEKMRETIAQITRERLPGILDSHRLLMSQREGGFDAQNEMAFPGNGLVWKAGRRNSVHEVYFALEVSHPFVNKTISIYHSISSPVVDENVPVVLRSLKVLIEGLAKRYPEINLICLEVLKEIPDLE